MRSRSRAATSPSRPIEDLWRRAGLPVAALERLAEADAFGSLGSTAAMRSGRSRDWATTQLALFAAADERDEHSPPGSSRAGGLPDADEGRTRGRRGLSLEGPHPATASRRFPARRADPSAASSPAPISNAYAHGQRVTVAGLVLVRQKPGSAKGVMFMTIEDETDVANLVIWPSLYEKQRRLILSSGMIGCRGRLQREGDVTHLVAEHLIDLSDLLRSVASRDDALHLPQGQGSKEPIIKVATRDFR